MTAQSNAARVLAAKQAEDAGLWFVAKTAPEAYLQAALRDLHAAVESGEPASGAWVPLEPTPEMCEAAMDVLMSGGYVYSRSDSTTVIETYTPRRIYEVMLAASPKPGGKAGGA